MKIVFLTDNIKYLNIEKDNSLYLMNYGRILGQEIFYLPTENISALSGRIIGTIFPIDFEENSGEIILGSKVTVDLAKDVDVILIRNNPPFDENYLTITYLLEKIKDEVLILNDPTTLRNLPEKIINLLDQEITVPTLFSKNKEQVLEFIEKHETVVFKPIYSYGGNNIFVVRKSDPNLSTILNLYLQNNIYWITQPFLKEVENGDKRVIIIDGKIFAVVNRIPKKGGFLSNMFWDSKLEPSILTEKQLQAVNKAIEFVKQHNILFAGLDLIGDYITEVNITSPAFMLKFLREFHNKEFAEDIWAIILRKTKEFYEN